MEEHQCYTVEDRQALEREWYAGNLFVQACCLLVFARQLRDEIRAEAGGAAATLEAVARAVRALVARYGTVHYPSEMRDQLQEIQKELWYRGEEGNQNREEIIANWTRRWAGPWRVWRTKQYYFVTGMIAEQIARDLTDDRE